MPDDPKNPDGFVLKSDCDESMGLIRLALFGPDLRGGIVKDIGDIKSDMQLVRERIKNRWGAKDKAAIIAALITACAAIIVALLK